LEEIRRKAMQKNTFRLTRSLTVLLIIAVCIGLFVHCQPSTHNNLDTVKIRLKWIDQAQFAGFYTAKEKGFYRDNNIDAILEPGGVDFPAVQMVSSGSDDFGVTGADQILLAREKGVPIVAVAVIYRKSPFCYFALKESGITNPQDFVGKNIGVKLGGNEELTYRAMMKRAGVDTKKVNEIPVKFDMSPLFTGQVVAWPGYSINEPIVAQEQGHEVNLIWPSDYGVNLYADTLFTTETMIRDKPDLVKRVIAATVKGWEYAIAHQDEAVKFTLKQSDKLKEAHESAMMKASVDLLKPDDKPIGWMDKAKWEEMQNLLLEVGFMKNALDVDKAFTAQFLGDGTSK
jgi:ABC-type nitrate/sulfonate/bicarbonate transport system substrate-binding protein